METQTVEVTPPAFVPNKALSGEPRNREKMCRVRIDCTTMGQALRNCVLRLGVQTIMVYESEVPGLSALVERDTQKLESAIEDYETNLNEYLNAGLENIPLDAVLEKMKQERALTYPGSVPATFRSRFKRDLLPFRSFEVLEKDLPSPEEEERISMETANARHITRAVAEVMTQMQQAGKNTKS